MVRRSRGERGRNRDPEIRDRRCTFGRGTCCVPCLHKSANRSPPCRTPVPGDYATETPGSAETSGVGRTHPRRSVLLPAQARRPERPRRLRSRAPARSWAASRCPPLLGQAAGPSSWFAREISNTRRLAAIRRSSYLQVVTRLSHRDLRNALEFVHAASSGHGSEPFPQPAVDLLARVAPAEYIGYYEWDNQTRYRPITAVELPVVSVPPEVAEARMEYCRSYPPRSCADASLTSAARCSAGRTGSTPCAPQRPRAVPRRRATQPL